MLTRLCLTLINLFFPPLAVLLLTGPYTDTLINCLLFVAGVIPSHVHGFYISCTYFHRRSKVRKGRYPGGPKGGIFDEKVWRGGASGERVEELRAVGEEKKKKKGERKRRKRDGGRGKTDRGESRRRMDGFEGNAGFVGDVHDYEGYDGHGRDGASYRGHRRSEMTEGYR